MADYRLFSPPGVVAMGNAQSSWMSRPNLYVLVGDDKGARRVLGSIHIFYITSEVCLVETNLASQSEEKVQTLIKQRVEKGTIYSGAAAVVPLDLGNSESDKKWVCYYCAPELKRQTEQDDKQQYIVCFISEEHRQLDVFRDDLDCYCEEIVKQIYQEGGSISETINSSLVNWYTVAVEYLIRCQQSLQDNLRYLIYSALLDNQLVTSGGTDEQQADIQRFYRACSLSEILGQLKDGGQKADPDSLSGSLDLLIDVGNTQTDIQDTLTVSISAESVKLDSNKCNRYCEDWSNALNRPDFLDNPVKQKQVIEAFKLKFIQTMNSLHRLLQEAENDFYALYRLFVFLCKSGNTEILLHYVSVAATSESAKVLKVLQECLQDSGV